MARSENCNDCSKPLRIWENCTAETMQEGVCSDCYIIRKNRPVKPLNS